jgi:hypothetical protein
MMTLVKEGVLFLKDAEQDTYEVIRHETNLGPAILEILIKGCSHLDQHQSVSGIQLLYVLNSLKMSVDFRYVPKASIEKSLREMVKCSEIWEVANKMYRPFS